MPAAPSTGIIRNSKRPNEKAPNGKNTVYRVRCNEVAFALVACAALVVLPLFLLFLLFLLSVLLLLFLPVSCSCCSCCFCLCRCCSSCCSMLLLSYHLSCSCFLLHLGSEAAAERPPSQGAAQRQQQKQSTTAVNSDDTYQSVIAGMSHLLDCPTVFCMQARSPH